jgi:hypothetical protein
MSECVWINPWTDSGDRGAARVDHDRAFHPDHAHDWGWSDYEWEQKGAMHIAPGDKTVRTPRKNTVRRCIVCKIRKEDNREGDCAPHVTW